MSLYNLTKLDRLRSMLTVSAAGYSLSSLVAFFLTLRYFENYTYVDLKYSKLARSAYMPIKALAILELIFALFMLFVSLCIIIDFIKEHTDVSPSDPSYSKTNEKNHAMTVRNTLPVFVISALIHVMKCLSVFLKQTSTVLHTDANTEGIIASGIPAMDTLIFLACAVYVICCFVKASNLKDEVKFKYGKE